MPVGGLELFFFFSGCTTNVYIFAYPEYRSFIWDFAVTDQCYVVLRYYNVSLNNDVQSLQSSYFLVFYHLGFKGCWLLK